MINYKYCPQCKKDLDISGEYPYCSKCNLTIYLNSKPTASILPIDGNKVLLSKRGIEPYKGCWDIIGGFLKLGESPQDGVLREVLEETKLNMKITGLLNIYMDKYGPGGDDTLNIVYLGKIISGDMKAQDDVASLEWVDIQKLDTINVGFKNTLSALKDLKKLYS